MANEVQSCFSWCYRCINAAFSRILSMPAGSKADDPVSIIGRRLSFPSPDRAGLSVVPSRLIAEGGFSYVYADSLGRYAIKVVPVDDDKGSSAVRDEAEMHRILSGSHVLPLLGHTRSQTKQGRRLSLLLFPLIKNSLRSVLNERLCLDRSGTENPLDIISLLRLFDGVAEAVETCHDKGLTHRDIKIENILLEGNNPYHSLLMDLGSAGPAILKVKSRLDLMNLTESAGEHTTVSYRAPELFEGGLNVASSCADGVIDLKSADIWALGCVLFAMMYGYSPFECEFRTDGSGVRVVECSHLRVLGKVPLPPQNSRMALRYPSEIIDTLVSRMCLQELSERPDIAWVREVVQQLIMRFTNDWSSINSDGGPKTDEKDEFEQWASTRV